MGRFSGHVPMLGNPLPGLTARPLPKGEVPPGIRIEAENTRHLHQPSGWGEGRKGEGQSCSSAASKDSADVEVTP